MLSHVLRRARPDMEKIRVPKVRPTHKKNPTRDFLAATLLKKPRVKERREYLFPRFPACPPLGASHSAASRASSILMALQVEDVTLYRQGKKVEGILYLTAHHIIFSYEIPPPPEQTQAAEQRAKPKELWITYPMINFCIYRPAPPASRQPPSIRLRCRDFTYVAFHFASEGKARDVYDSIRSLTCRLGRLEKLYAFSYTPQPPENKVNGWELYDAEKEWRRLGIGGKNADHGWRISRINSDYEVSCCSPKRLFVD
jgi:hypothetical protein